MNPPEQRQAAGDPAAPARAAALVPGPPGRIREAVTRAERHIRRWLGRLRSAIGLRRGFKVYLARGAGMGGRRGGGGVYYKELSAESLQRALSKKGRGWKEYRVTFPDGSKQIIRCSAQRVYDDVMAPLGYDAGQGVLAPLLEIIRPGSRLLLLHAGTGAAGAWLGAAVGRSGAVVALEPDEQSVEFAVARYPQPNVSFEVGGVDGLRGEIDGSFQGAAVLRPIPGDDGHAALAEVWRVIAPGGWLLAACAAGEGDAVAAAMRAMPGVDGTGVRTDGAGSATPDLVFVTKLPDPRGDDGPKGPPDRKGPNGRGGGPGGMEVRS